MASASRWLAFAAVAGVLIGVCAQHGHSGMKGADIPVTDVIGCILAAAVAAYLCQRHWLSVAAPFVAGIAGVLGIAGQFYGPFGGVVGLLVGLLVVLLPSSRQHFRSAEDMSHEIRLS